jgi:pectin methylesterase-like acyl-CoA thioesterase
MRNGKMRLIGAAAAFVALATIVVGCGSDGGSDAGGGEDTEETTETGGELDAIRVPEDFETIQEAVDNASEGDIVLVGEGTYNEAVDVTTPDITIRGVDRNEVILDGEFELENGIRVLDTDGVVVENMTAATTCRTASSGPARTATAART